MRRRALLGLLSLVWAIPGCGGEGPSAPANDGGLGGGSARCGPAPVTALTGEVHLHQFPDGAHAWTAFIEPPLPIQAMHGDSVTEVDTAATSIVGPCTLYMAPTCSRQCSDSSFCYAPNDCANLPSWTYIDGGPVQVTGSSVVPLIRMWWNASAAAYDADPAPGFTHLFAGGDDLELLGGSGPYAFTGDVPAPLPVSLISPDPRADFLLETNGPFEISWVSDHSDEIEILITAYATSGASAEIRCVTTDTGAFTIPASLMRALPPPPRETRFEIVRNEQRVLPVARDGLGVYVHAAQSTWMNGQD